MKKLHGILLVLGLVFLTYLVSTIGVGELWRELTSLGWGLIPLILIEGLADLIHTMGWRRCLSGPHQSLPLVVLFCIRMAGFAINYLTPTASLGGEVTKAALLASNHRGPEAASGVLIGKICFAFAHLLFVAVGSMTILWHVKLPRALWVGMLISSALLAGGMVAFLLIQKYGKLGMVVRWLVAHKLGGRLLQRAARDITEVDEALKLFYRTRPWDLPLGVCWHLLGYMVGIVQTWFFFYLLKQDAAFVVAAAAWVLSLWLDLLTFAIPLRLGALEGGRIVAFKAVGSDALLGMTYGVAIRLAELFWAGFGLVSYGLLSRGGHLRDA
jgi:uncharacterized protein (TIRG00374 family)